MSSKLVNEYYFSHEFQYFLFIFKDLYINMPISASSGLYTVFFLIKLIKSPIFEANVYSIKT